MLPESVLPPGWEADDGFLTEHLHDFQRSLLRSAALLYGAPRRTVDAIQTIGEAHQFLQDQAFSTSKVRWRLVFGRNPIPWRTMNWAVPSS